MIIHNMDQHSTEWYEIRTGRVTATRFQTLLMKENTKGYQGMVSELAAEILTGGDIEESYQNETMIRGIDMEPYAKQEFCDTIHHITECGFITPDEGTSFFEWIGISPDGLLMEEEEPIAGIEIKCPLAKTHLSYIEKGVCPTEYINQVQASLFVTGLPVWYFMSYYPKLKPFVIEVLPDYELHEMYILRLTDFIAKIEYKIEKYKQYGHQDQGQIV